jgi:vitamin B12/bleomycin/antimicrobial peptide transport system ATP-binding/permease protein
MAVIDIDRTPLPKPAATSLSEVRKVIDAFIATAGGYWRGPTKHQAYLLSALLVTAVGINVMFHAALNRWNGWFFNGLEKRDVDTVWAAISVFPLIVLAIAAIQVVIIMSRMTIQVHWRAWLTKYQLGHWIGGQKFYRLEMSGLSPGNPEYRIADDTRLATEPVIDLSIGLTAAIITAVTFFGILWQVGGSWTFNIAGSSITIPAFMVFCSFLYSLCATTLIFVVGRPLVGIVKAKNEAEARFRAELTRLRENGESIALIKGGGDERRILDKTYSSVIGRWLEITRQHGRLTWILNGNAVLAPVLPLVLCTPKYLAGQMSLGDVVQIAAAFVQVQVAINFLVDNYVRTADWYASARRNLELLEGLAAVDAEQQGTADRLETVGSGDGSIRLQGVSITQRNGDMLIDPSDLTITKGERLLIVGESGIGKSTLMRAIAGLWPWGRGTIHVPLEARVAFVPQKPYLPLGTLREVMLYPEKEMDIGDQALANMLDRVGLSALKSRLHETDRWDQTLSSGERQRLAFARLLIARPEVIFLDEATAALDETNESIMMGLIVEELPDATVVSVGHRPGLEQFHHRKASLRRVDGRTRIDAVGVVKRVSSAA